MNIVILGAGALGAYFGSRLQEAGQHVSYLVREKRAAQLKDNGLTIHSVKGNYIADQLTVFTNAEDISNPDLVLLAVKGYHLNGTLSDLKTLTSKGAKVLPLLNGIEHIDILQKELGEEQVIGGLSFIIATLDENGHVVHSSNQHDLVFGPLHPAQEEICHSFASACEKANMNSRLSPSILEELWQKYMFITAFSGMTTAANLPIGVLRESETTMETIREVLMEVKELADAYHVQLEDKHVEAAIQQILTFPAESTSSMHQDKRKGLTLEVDHLQGGAIRLAQKADLHLPVVKTLYSLIKPYENGAIK